MGLPATTTWCGGGTGRHLSLCSSAPIPAEMEKFHLTPDLVLFFFGSSCWCLRSAMGFVDPKWRSSSSGSADHTDDWGRRAEWVMSTEEPRKLMSRQTKFPLIIWCSHIIAQQMCHAVHPRVPRRKRKSCLSAQQLGQRVSLSMDCLVSGATTWEKGGEASQV